MTIVYVWGVLIIFTIVFIFVGIIIERFFDEDSSVMKWWRKYFVGKLEDDDME